MLQNSPFPAPTEHPSPLVTLINGRPATTSIEVAKFFGKRHDNIVRDIRNILSNCPETFRALNFEETFREVEGPNGSTRKEAFFYLYRDGFTLTGNGLYRQGGHAI